MATGGSSSSGDAYSTTHSVDIYYSNEDIALLHEVVLKAETLLPTLPEPERFPTQALFHVFNELSPQRHLSVDDETKFQRVLFKIGGAPNQSSLLENFENVLSRMGIDVEFSIKDGGTRTDLDGLRIQRDEVDSLSDHDTDEHGSKSMDIEKSTRGLAAIPSTIRRYANANVEPHTNGDAESRSIHSAQEQEQHQVYEEDLTHAEYPPTFDLKKAGTGTSDFSVTPSEATIAGIREVLAVRHFRHYKLLHIVNHWKRTALEQREDNTGLATIAEHRDRRVLLQSAVDDWRSKLELKRKAQNDDADAALARRHIVRTKFFYAWKNLAIANKLTAQEAEAEARKAYEEKRKASLMRKYLRQWNTTITRRKQKEEAAETFLTSCLKKKFFGLNLSKIIPDPVSNIVIKLEPQPILAHAVQMGKSLGTSISILKEVPKIMEAETIPKEQRDVLLAVRQLAAEQMAQPVIDIWRQRSQQENEAALIDRTKILREAWTVWQDTMRINMVDDTTLSRILSLCLYRLIATARALSFAKRTNERIKRAVFGTWCRKAKIVADAGRSNDATAQAHIASKRKDACFAQLSLLIERHEKSEESALGFYNSRLLRSKTSCWETKTQHANELQQWSKDARFFFLATKSVNKWKSAAEESRREKRKQAYAQLRRSQKMNMARSTLKAWRDKAHKALQLSQQGEGFIHNKTVVSAMDMLDRWRAHAEDLSEMEVSAVKMQQRKAKNAWSDRLNAVRDISVEADGVYAERHGKQALRQWSLEVLKVRAKSNYADDILDKHSKKVFRRTFTTWKSRSVKQELPEPPLTTARASRYAQSTYVSSVVPDTFIEESSEGLAFEVPEIDFETPSKPPRLPSTTPAAPLSTAAESRLRAQFADSSRSVRRSLRKEGRGSGTPRA